MLFGMWGSLMIWALNNENNYLQENEDGSNYGCLIAH